MEGLQVFRVRGKSRSADDLLRHVACVFGGLRMLAATLEAGSLNRSEMCCLIGGEFTSEQDVKFSGACVNEDEYLQMP